MKIEELFVSKLVSQNPDEYKALGLNTMANKYGEYCRNFQVGIESPKLDVLGRQAMKCKTFDEWLLTEL